MIVKGIGCDIVNIDRIRDNIAEKILSKKELEIYNSIPSQGAKEFLAGRFAAKEAIFKAIGAEKIDFKEIEISYVEHGRPHGFWLNETFLVSIAHESDKAVAFALWVDETIEERAN